MRRWTRPYGGGDIVYVARYVTAGLMSVVGLSPSYGVFSGELTAASAAAIVGFVVVWEVAVWRIALVGVYVNDFGVKVRKVTRTQVVPWSRIVRAWAGQAAHYDAWQIWISVRDPERDIETPIWRMGSKARHNNRVALAPKEFAATLAALNQRQRLQSTGIITHSANHDSELPEADKT